MVALLAARKFHAADILSRSYMMYLLDNMFTLSAFARHHCERHSIMKNAINRNFESHDRRSIRHIATMKRHVDFKSKGSIVQTDLLCLA